jgi:hypothetical protein
MQRGVKQTKKTELNLNGSDRKGTSIRSWRKDRGRGVPKRKERITQREREEVPTSAGRCGRETNKNKQPSKQTAPLLALSSFTSSTFPLCREAFSTDSLAPVALRRRITAVIFLCKKKKKGSKDENSGVNYVCAYIYIRTYLFSPLHHTTTFFSHLFLFLFFAFPCVVTSSVCVFG